MPKYKNGKNVTPIKFKFFKECVEKADFVPFAKTRNISLLATLFYSGARVSQILGLRKEDVTILDGHITLKLQAQKKGREATIKISLSLPFAKDILRQIKKAGDDERIWNISRQSAWVITKTTFGPKFYPHFFRLNRATHFLEDSTTTLPEMLAWFSWKSAKTVDSYIGFCGRYTDRQAERLMQNP